MIKQFPTICWGPVEQELQAKLEKRASELGITVDVLKAQMEQKKAEREAQTAN